MKSLLKTLDSAIGDIYAIDTRLQAQDFLLKPHAFKETGALIVQTAADAQGRSEVEVGIVFHPKIAQDLKSAETLDFSHWSPAQLQAFAVAAEEISHFRYFIFNAERDRAVSQLELEFQGEIDKFLLFFFLTIPEGSNQTGTFDQLFTWLFEQFSLVEGLNSEQVKRYGEANQFAREFIQKHRADFRSPQAITNLLDKLRALYRMSSTEKFSLRHRL